jgi:hypothetical protein
MSSSLKRPFAASLSALLIVVLAVSCQSEPSDQESADDAAPPADYDSFGAAIGADGAIALTSALESAGAGATPVKVSATINEVCQVKGCWMVLDAGEHDDIMVTFKDYGFFVPKDASGREVILEGVLQPVERSVEELRHLAQDAGKSDEEIAAITEPEVALAIEATGVLIAKSD